ncbi:MAG: hypothetical protein GX595_16080 [Lentisphaerae bacterium]|nr:hypothetical protein [Lentisphaerota bacterium]
MTRHPFNMIEVLLALGVIAIGAISVLALFPYGLASTRDSVAESFAGDSADQFLHWFAAQAQRDWATYAGDSTWLPDDKREVPDKDDDVYVEPDSWGAATDITPNLRYERHSTDGVLKVIFQRNGTPPVVDFSGVYRMWNDPVTVPNPQLLNDPLATPPIIPLTTESALAINLEASWPAEIPYNRRQKAVYRIEIFRP